jgi:hypothetical protein
LLLSCFPATVQENKAIQATPGISLVACFTMRICFAILSVLLSNGNSSDGIKFCINEYYPASAKRHRGRLLPLSGNGTILGRRLNMHTSDVPFFSAYANAL